MGWANALMIAENIKNKQFLLNLMQNKEINQVSLVEFE